MVLWTANVWLTASVTKGISIALVITFKPN
jgi:hypothetical protein